jgi:hypothetical protein
MILIALTCFFFVFILGFGCGCLVSYHWTIDVIKIGLSRDLLKKLNDHSTDKTGQ